MAGIQVRCTLRDVNGVAANNCVNTFAVSGVTPGVDDENIADKFRDFYTVDHSPNPSIDSFINDTILRANGLIVDLVDTPQTVPNAPYHSAPYTLGASATGVPLPQEVAVCLSLHTTAYLTSATPGRERGRVYIGPLNVGGTFDPGTGSVARPNPDLIGSMVGAAGALWDALDGLGYAWCVWSRADDDFGPISGGWVDDEFDTQRRRGHVRTTRNPFTLPL